MKVKLERITNWMSGRKEWTGLTLVDALKRMDKLGYKATSAETGKITGKRYIYFTKQNCLTTYQIVIEA